MIATDIRLGHPNLTGGGCCGKPLGCTSSSGLCQYLRHPWKRAMVFGDPTVQCQATCLRPHPETGVSVDMQCVLANGHDGECDPQPMK